jgi:AraC-like DNA-binding protein
MIVVRCRDPLLRQAVVAAAHAEEDVVTDARPAVEALRSGFPRLLVRSGKLDPRERSTGVRLLELDDLLLKRWKAGWRSLKSPLPELDYLVQRLGGLIERSAQEVTWVDRALADLTRAAGARLPVPLRAFARRVMEFPTHYTRLQVVADACGISHGALKARFRRRGLPSPSVYLRWFRLMAAAEMLSDRSVSVGAAAHRLGFTSGANLCRTVATLTELTPTEVRTVRGWNRLLITFAWSHLTPAALDRWAGLEELFQRRAPAVAERVEAARVS